MANLQFLTNVMHNGVLFSGPQIRDNRVVSDGMIVDLEADARKLKEVAESLVERGLAKFTNDPATHSSNFVNGAQEAMQVDAPAGTGQAPTIDQIKQQQAAQQAQAQAHAAAQPAATPQTPAQPTPEQQPSDAAGAQ